MTKRTEMGATPDEVIRQWFRSKCARWRLDNATRAAEAILAELDAAGFVIVAKANLEVRQHSAASAKEM